MRKDEVGAQVDFDTGWCASQLEVECVLIIPSLFDMNSTLPSLTLMLTL